MDPDTGAAGYMISGGLAGGSAAVDMGVYTIGIAAVIMAVCDTVQIGIALLSVTNPIVGVIFYTLYAASIVSTITTIYNIEMYWKTGDYQYAIQLTNDLLLNLAFFTGFKVLEGILPGITTLFKAVKNQIDDVANAGELYGDDVIEGIIRSSGTDIIQEAETIIKGLTDSSVNSLLINKVSLTQGLDGLASLKYLLDNGKITQEIADDLVTKGFNLYDVKSLVDRGIEVIEFSKYGITNGTEAKVIADLVTKGYRLEDLAKLVEFGYKPSGMISKGLKTAEAVMKAVGSVFERVKSVFTNGDELRIVDAITGQEVSPCRSNLKAILMSEGMTDEAAESALQVLETGCFSGDTLVKTRDGSKRIDEIQEGDYVLAKDVNTGESGYKTVKQVYIKSTTEFIYLNIEGEEVKTTATHLFFTDSGWWKAAENIKQGDKIVDSNGIMKEVNSAIVKKFVEPERIYNLNVEDYHTYFVGIKGLLVHNDCTPEMSAFKRLQAETYINKSAAEIADFYGGKVAGKTSLFKTYPASAQPSEILREELKAADVITPPYSNQAHHIIPEGMDVPELNQVRALMDEYGVNLNSASNGVFLPDAQNLKYAGNATVHSGSHTAEYARYVANAIIRAEPKSAADIVAVLNDLREQLLEGTLILNSL